MLEGIAAPLAFPVLFPSLSKGTKRAEQKGDSRDSESPGVRSRRLPVFMNSSTTPTEHWEKKTKHIPQLPSAIYLDHMYSQTPADA